MQAFLLSVRYVHFGRGAVPVYGAAPEQRERGCRDEYVFKAGFSLFHRFGAGVGAGAFVPALPFRQQPGAQVDQPRLYGRAVRPAVRQRTVHPVPGFPPGGKKHAGQPAVEQHSDAAADGGGDDRHRVSGRYPAAEGDEDPPVGLQPALGQCQRADLPAVFRRLGRDGGGVLLFCRPVHPAGAGLAFPQSGVFLCHWRFFRRVRHRLCVFYPPDGAHPQLCP